MENVYNEVHAKEFISHYPDIAEELALRIYTSRLLGANPNLVLHGGGNTSIKLIQKNTESGRFRTLISISQTNRSLIQSFFGRNFQIENHF